MSPLYHAYIDLITLFYDGYTVVLFVYLFTDKGWQIPLNPSIYLPASKECDISGKNGQASSQTGILKAKIDEINLRRPSKAQGVHT
jgi:hypothetical protein